MSIIKNQQAFDINQQREKHCAIWLKEQKKIVKHLIYKTALAGIFQGILVIFQSALLAIVLHQLIIENQQWNQLTNSIILLGFIFLFRSIFSYFSQTWGYQVSAVLKRSVRDALLSKFSALGPAYINQHDSAELAATTLEQTEALEGYFSRYLPQQIIVSVLPLIIIISVFPVNWVVAIIFLVTGPVAPLFMALIGMGAASANRNQFLAMSRMSGYFFDRLQGLSTLKLFGQAERELINIAKVADSFRDTTMAVLRIAFLSSAVLEFFSAVAVALVAVYVGLGLLGLVHFGPAVDINLQEALFVLLLAPEFFNPLKQLAANYHDKAAAIGAADHILKVLEQQEIENEANEVQTESDFCIEFQNVHKSYQKKQVLKAINLQIKAGEKVAIIGESGIGKTTLFNLLLGFEPVSKGNIYINRQKITREYAEQNIAFAAQQPTIFYASIRDNISLWNKTLSDQKIQAAADAAGVTDYSKYLENDLLTWVGERGYGLSGGQVQRIALARAFVKNVPIVMLDEPTAHLDNDTKIKLLDAIEQLFKDKTLIIASHDPLVIERMNRSVSLR